jgi:nickel-dependent lactate racemase
MQAYILKILLSCLLWEVIDDTLRKRRIKLVGEDVYARVHTVDSDPEDTVYLGMTQYGTPVNITSFVAQADRRICLGNIEYHYFAGYSGGGKAIMLGVSDRAAIQANHSRMVRSVPERVR